MSIAPYFRSPFTDLTGALVSHQNNGKCAPMEMRMMECLEAYGMERGMKNERCKLLIDDFKECEGRMKQYKRMEAMRIERHRQYLMGESKEHYAPGPRVDAY